MIASRPAVNWRATFDCAKTACERRWNFAMVRQPETQQARNSRSSRRQMTVCFDVETAWQEAFRYGWLTDYESAWEDVAALKPRITGATAYIIDLNEWRSFRPEEISGLCSLVASASRVVTFNGKRWDIPVIGRHSPSKAVTAKLRLLIEERAENHDDLCQIAPGKLLDLYLLNFDRKLADGWSQSAEDYKSRLIDAGWEIHPAYKASQAYSDTGKTHELWTRWRKGSLQRG